MGNSKDFLSEFDLLAARGIVGIFDQFELFEVVQYVDDSNHPTNVFTIAIAVEGGDRESARFLNDKRMVLRGLKEYRFGICRSVLTIDAFRQVLYTCLVSGVWKPGTVGVGIGRLQPSPKYFSPPDSMSEIPINRVLKNNFFSGSYALELFDVEKQSHNHFKESPTALQELSEKISAIVPIRIASLSDRLGNIVIQFPIEAIRAEFRTDGARYQAEIAWHPKIAERKLIVTGRAEYDHSVVSFYQKEVFSGFVSLGADPGYGALNGVVWDAENRIILAATGELSFIKTISMNLAAGVHEPRMIPESVEDKAASKKIKLSSQPMLSMIGDTQLASIAQSIRRRTYADELAALSRQRKFVQYAAQPRSGTSDRDRALSDVRGLIDSHGAFGVWLWDPFLAPQDILDTLFYNRTSNAPMCALTALKKQRVVGPERPSQLRSSGSNRCLRVLKTTTKGVLSYREETSKSSLICSHRKVLSSLPGNFHGLCIEYRSAHGPRAWDFHDRFLIFPKSKVEPAKAWSLGTSVNSLGKTHHILQQVDNAQLIADAFQALWNAVDHPDNLIWKCP